jgi:hypothetical protein
VFPPVLSSKQENRPQADLQTILAIFIGHKLKFVTYIVYGVETFCPVIHQYGVVDVEVKHKSAL